MQRNIDESFKQRKSKIELITFDINRNLQYQGICKIKCNRISEALIAEPINEDLETVTASFKWKIITKKNILFIFGEKEFQDFALIFNKKIRCRKVYKLIFEKKEKDHVKEDQFQKRFLIPFYKELVENGGINESMKTLIKKWIRKEDANEIKEEYLSLIDNINCKKVDETENHTEVSRKRKREISENSSSKKTTTKTIQQSNFKILNYKCQLRLQRRLVIFTSNQKTHCLQFIQKPHSTDYRCFGCKEYKKRNIAYIFKDKNGNDCVKLETNSHQCKEFPYIPEDYIEIKYLKKPNFELWKNTENKNRQTLVIFDEMDKNFCYEYFWNSTKQLYSCCGCSTKRKKLTAKVFFDEKNEEYLEINDDNHICEKRQYEKEKYEKTYNFILKPDFEIRKKMKDGVEKQYLIIRDSSNKNKCYKYFNHYGNYYLCWRCATESKNVTAKLHTNDENEEYVILSNIEHICKSVPYIPLKSDEIADEKILYPPAFKFLENSSNGAPKLFIFVKNNQKMCYIFHRVFGKENKYFCNGCHFAKIKECTVLDEFGQKIKGAVYVYLCKDSDGKLSVKLPNHQHICEPKKYQPEKYRNLKAPKQRSLKFDKSKIIRKPNFELQKNTKGNPKGKLVVFDANDKSLCYEYCLAENYFYCGKCRFKNNHVTAKLYPSIGSNETDEYIVLGENQHVCEPVKYESQACFDASNFMIFYQNDKSKLTKIILFTSPSKEYCYEFTWHETAKHFFCYPCKSCAIKKHVTGKLINGNFVMFTKNEHSCEPKKFVFEKYQPKTIPESLFELGSNIRGKPNTKLYLFTSEKKEFFYEFYSTRLPQFICLQCITIDNTLYVKVKLVENENGEKYLEIDSTKEHICQPKITEKNTIHNFQLLHSSKNGDPKIQLIILDENDNNFGYEFTKYKNAKCYSCRGCTNEKRKHISAKICSDKNGKEFIQMNESEHVCKKRNFSKTGKIIQSKHFVLKENENGRQIITTNYQNGKKLCYKFIFDSKLGTFCCEKCKEKQRYVTATICKNKNDNEFLLLNDKHFCTPILKNKISC